MSQPDYDELPNTLVLREIKVSESVIITTLKDAKKFPKKSIAAIYGRRWLIELDLRSIKCDMQMGTLRCKSPDMVQKEVAAHLLGYNLIRIALAQSASLHCLHPRQLSFKGSLQLINAFQVILLAGEEDERKMEIRLKLLKAIASTLIGNREREPEPRAVKRRPKPYPLLTEPRNEAKQRLAYA